MIKYIVLSISISFYSYCLAQSFEFSTFDSHTNASFRALSVIDDNHAWVAGSNGWFGRTNDGGITWEFDQIKLFEEMDFRTLFAFDELNAVIANAGSPAYILRTLDGGENWLPVYQNSDPEIFIDGIDFWNSLEGVIYGDPINGKMTLLKTLDGGYSWESISEDNRPDMEKGEASFAASGTGIRCVSNNEIYISSGGNKSRIFYSEDRGNNWEFISVPIVQGEQSEGIYSITISANNIVVVGGDYTKEDVSENSAFYSVNGGKKWKSPLVPTNGYRESVEFINEKILISTGPNGTDLSSDIGKSWTKLRDAEGMHVVRKARKGNLIIIAGRSGKMLINSPK